MHRPEISKKSNKARSEKNAKEIEQMTNEHTILGGDYNLHMNQWLDKLDKSHEQQDSRNYRSDIGSYININIDKKYSVLHGKISSDSQVDDNIINEFQNVKSQLENIERDATMGAIIRSKAQWLEEGGETHLIFYT